MSHDSLARGFARFTNQLQYDDFTSDQVYKLKTYFLDWIGSAFAGHSKPPVKMMLDVVHDLGGNPESTLIPDKTKTMAPLAAMVNGASSHIVEMDDLHRESVFHPAAPIIPAVFAAAERTKADGRTLLTAIAAGYEVGIRVAVSVGTSHYRYWHTTSTCGTFGAAAGAAKTLGLDEEGVVWALGSAGTQASGLWAFLVENAMSKQLHPGKAALNGLLAAFLAQRGFTGAQYILEGDKGFFKATSRDFDASRCVDGLGRVFLFERNSLKYHASCGHTHSAIDAVLQAAGSMSVNPGDIKELSVHVYEEALELLEKVEPITPYLAKFSLPFCVATAMRYGRVGLDDFTESRLQEPDIIALMGKVRLFGEPELSRQYPAKWPARVEIVTGDGKTLKGASDFPKGDPENPFTEQELIKKFNGLTADALKENERNSLFERVMALEEVQDVSQLLNLT